MWCCKLPHLVLSDWSFLELSWAGRRFQKSHWTLSRLKWENAGTVVTEPPPGWTSREDLGPVYNVYIIHIPNPGL